MVKGTEPSAFKGTELGRVRGLGSSHHGAGDWLLMRYTSVAVLLVGLALFGVVLVILFELLRMLRGAPRRLGRRRRRSRTSRCCSWAGRRSASEPAASRW